MFYFIDNGIKVRTAYGVLIYTSHALQLAYDLPRTVRGESGRLWAAAGGLRTCCM